MKFLLSRLLLFIIPFFLLIVGIESFILYYPNSFNTKAKYFHENVHKTKIWILGSSHNQNALNPEFFSTPTLSIANAGQDLKTDSSIINSFINLADSLRLVILEIDYHTMEETNKPDYFRLPWYYKFYGIEIHSVPYYKKKLMYLSNPSFFNKLIFDEINPSKPHFTVNKFGFITNDFPGIMQALFYDSLKLEQTANLRLAEKHKTNSKEIFVQNEKRMNSIIHECTKRGIKVLLLSTPMYETYIKRQIPEKIQRRLNYIDSLKNIIGIHYYNFEQDSSFTVKDFKNDDHLNSSGAEKFTRIIDDISNQILSKN